MFIGLGKEKTFQTNRSCFSIILLFACIFILKTNNSFLYGVQIKS